MASELDYTIHLLEQVARRIARNEIRRSRLNTEAKDSTRRFADGGLGSVVGGFDPATGAGTGTDGSEMAGGIDAVGNDYGAWPIIRQTFDNGNNRFANLDFYVASSYISRMRGLASDGGHTHSGVHGEGPRIPIQNIVMSDGGTLADFLGVAYADADAEASGTTSTATGGIPEAPSWSKGERRDVVFDDFEVDDQNLRFEVIAGTATRFQNSEGNWSWKLGTGTLIRVKSPGFTFNDRISVRLDVRWGLGDLERTLDIRLRSRVTEDGYSYVASFSSTKACYIGELDYATGVLTILNPISSDYTLPTTDVMHEVSAMLNGADIQAGSEFGQQAVTAARDDSEDAGWVELYVPGEPAYIENFYLSRVSHHLGVAHGSTHHADGDDPLDVKDLADSLGLLLGASGGTTGAHAPTHYAAGNDPLDISQLADLQGVRLTSAQRNALTQGQNADAYHTHAVLGASLETAAYPRVVARGPVLGAGTTVLPADHVHSTPHWKIEMYVSDAVPPNYAVDDADFDTAPLETVRYHYPPTLGGELFWQAYGNGLLWRARLKIKNNGATRSVALFLPYLVNSSLRVRVRNNTNGDLLLASYYDTNTQFNESVDFDLPGGETTLITLYGGGVGDELHAVAVLNTEDNGDLFDPTKALAWESVDVAPPATQTLSMSGIASTEAIGVINIIQ